MRVLHVAVSVVALVGCKKPHFEGPMPVVFGDCAGPAVSWISGPRPLPFDHAEADAWVTDEPSPAGVEAHDSPAVAHGGSGSGAHSVYRAGEGDSSGYHHGAANPFRAEEAALSECFRANPKYYGVVVIELASTNARVHGIDDEATRACVLEVAKRVNKGVAQRCSMAFGIMPPAELPAIDVSDAIKLDGTQLAVLPAIATATEPIPAVIAAVRARITAANAVTAPVVSLYGPLVIRPIETTPMNVVSRVMRSVLEAGDDFVLARRRGAIWEVLPRMELPVVPVPLGTGGRWNRVAARSPSNGDERVTLAILVSRDNIWIGLSRVNEFMVLDREGARLCQDADRAGKGRRTCDNATAERLDSVLEEHKTSAFFADRTDLEIAAQGDVTYGDVVDVIEAATKAGFVDWLVTDPRELAIQPSRDQSLEQYPAGY